MIDTLSPSVGEADALGSILYISELIAERQKKYFPDLKHRLSQMVKATQWSPIFCVAKPISTDLFFHPWST
jgi:hypothetical protein